MTARGLEDPDERAVRRASLAVGIQITAVAMVLVVVVVVVAFAFVLNHIRANRLFSHHEATIDIGGLDIITGAIVIGVCAIVLAAALSWFATRRAVRPLGEALRLQRAFVANASHELRTPLAVLDARLQYLQRGISKADPSAATVSELRRDTATLVQIVNDLLEAAEDAPQESGTVAADAVVDLAVESMRLLASDRDITIDFASRDTVTVSMPAAGIHRCVVALLDNALKFSPEGSVIEVDLHADGDAAELTVRDHGSGIHGIEPGEVFDRFARGSAHSGQPGFGIGLALVRDTVARYGGTVRVAYTGADGTEIVIRLPRGESPRRRRRRLS